MLRVPQYNCLQQAASAFSWQSVASCLPLRKWRLHVIESFEAETGSMLRPRIRPRLASSRLGEKQYKKHKTQNTKLGTMQEALLDERSGDMGQAPTVVLHLGCSPLFVKLLAISGRAVQPGKSLVIEVPLAKLTGQKQSGSALPDSAASAPLLNMASCRHTWPRHRFHLPCPTKSPSPGTCTVVTCCNPHQSLELLA